MASYYQFRADFEKSIQMGEKILELAESMDDDFMRIHAYLVIGVGSGFVFGLQLGLEYLDKGIALFDPHKQRLRPFQIGNNPGIVCYTASAVYTLWSGFPDQAVKRGEKAIELATSLNHPYTMAYALFHTGILYYWSGYLERARKNTLAMKKIATEHEYHLWSALATFLNGAVESSLGETEEGLARLEQGVASYLGHITPPVFWPTLSGIRAQAYGRAGRFAEGVSLLNELLGEEIQESTVMRMPDLVLLKGELLLALSPANAAEAAGIFKQILAVAQMTGNKIWALQAATRLSKLEMQEGNAEENIQALAGIYDSFTEGFDMVELQEARSVLEEWQG